MRIKTGGGVPVVPGPPGKDAYELALTRGVFSGTFDQWVKWLKGKDGDNGLSAYEIAVGDGYSGTPQQWQKDLQGPPGLPGSPGKPGAIGPMPHHEWRGTELRFQMTPDTWGPFVELKGEKGDKGDGSKAIASGGPITLDINGYMPQGW